MMWLWILAIVAQSADAGVTCHNLRRGAVERNPVLPNSCAGIVAMKAGSFGTVPLLPESKQRFALGLLAAGGAVGVTVTIVLK